MRAGPKNRKLKLAKKSKKTRQSGNDGKQMLPYASKSSAYDESWVEKQEQGFTSWLNFLFAEKEENIRVEVNGFILF